MLSLFEDLVSVFLYNMAQNSAEECKQGPLPYRFTLEELFRF